MAKFEKGQSGNPTGRPKRSRELKELAQKYTVEGIHKLVELMRQKSDMAIALKATQTLIERGWGKPQQTIEKTQHTTVTTEVSATEQARLVAFMLAQAQKKPKDLPTEISDSTETQTIQ